MYIATETVLRAPTRICRLSPSLWPPFLPQFLPLPRSQRLLRRCTTCRPSYHFFKAKGRSTCSNWAWSRQKCSSVWQLGSRRFLKTFESYASISARRGRAAKEWGKLYVPTVAFSDERQYIAQVRIISNNLHLLCRDFIERHYVELKQQNPTFPILIRECSGVEPKMYGRYGENCN